MTTLSRVKRGAGRLAGLLLAFLAATAATVAPADAGPGVRLSLGAITVDSGLIVGSSHRLPRLYVSNPGDEDAHYRMSAVAMDDADRPIPGDWLAFSPEQFRLRPGETRAVDIELTIPGDAHLGRYEGLLAAQIVTDPGGVSGPGARLGAGAAARLEFEVVAPTVLHALLSHVRSGWTAAGLWAWLASGLAVALVAFRWATRRFRFRVERR